MEGCTVQGFQDLEFVNPNPGLWEYKVKTGRSYPNTKEEWEVYKTWYLTSTHGRQVSKEKERNELTKSVSQ